jgi:uncharacterized membrane protein YraQ (UPF0718 family)
MNIISELLIDAWMVLCDMAPFLLFGFLAAGLLSVLIKREMIERHLGQGGVWGSVKASLFGVPLPLCSCSVIPVAVSMRKHGASKGAVISFLLSTPQTGVDSILVTFALLAPVFGARFALIFSLFRPVAAFITGVMGGALVEAATAGEQDGAPAEPAESGTSCCASKSASPGKLKQILTYAFKDLPADIARPLLIGILISAAISVLVPDDFFAPVLGNGLVAMLVLMGLSIPLYVCATGSVPVLVSLIIKGVSPAAAFAFLVAGPATNVATITTIWSSLGRRSAVLYLLTVAVSAVVFGYAIAAVLPEVLIHESAHMHDHVPGWFLHASAAVLLGLLIRPMIRLKAKTKSCCG